ncbi:MAG: signal peptidase I [Terracidiphilus sp.]
MTKRRDRESVPEPQVSASGESAKETPLEALAGICSVLVIGLFVLEFLCQNMVIPSGSMEKTLLIGDHLLVDHITFSPASPWMPLVHHRDPQRGDIVVFLRPAPEPEPDADGNPVYLTLVKRLIGMPGDHIHLRDGTVFINGVAQPLPTEGIETPPLPPSERAYVDDFPSVLPTVEDSHGAVTPWVVDLPNHIENGDLVVPPGKYFMMGDHRHASLDSRFWGFVPRENVLGRPLFNYWSFKTPHDQEDKKGLVNQVAWMAHVALHFFTDTRWSRTLHRVR